MPIQQTYNSKHLGTFNFYFKALLNNETDPSPSQDVLDSLQAKLGLKAVSHFSLVVEHVKSLKRNKLTLLNPRDTLAKVNNLLCICL